MKIVANGKVRISSKRGIGGGTSIIFLSGISGGAVCILGYFDDFGNFIPLVDGLISVGSQTQVNHGSDHPIYLKISSATGTTAMSLIINGKA